MNINQKGFANIILVVVIVILLGAVGYFAFVKKSEPVTQQPIQTSNQANTPASPTPTPTPTSAIKELSFKSCIDSLYQDNRFQYDFWKNKFATLHPGFRSIYDAGSYCELSDGTKLISFSHFATTDPKSAGQTISLFDGNNNLIRETKGFYCKTIGDLGTPKFDSIKDSKVRLSCSSGDAGYVAKQEYELNLSNFTYVELKNNVDATIKNSGTFSMTSINGPKSLASGQIGTWSVVAPSASRFAVIWADGTQVNVGGGSGIPYDSEFTTSPTFTHAFSKQGTYYVQFFAKVLDGKGTLDGKGFEITVQ